MSNALRLLVLIACSTAAIAESPWIRRFDGGFDDRASAIATDALGNVFVAGDIEHSDRTFEFAVVKYDATGVQRWTARFSNAQNGTHGGSAASVVVDSVGNVYAAGYVYTQVSLFVLNMDWLVASYAPDGTLRWSHRVNGTANVWDRAGPMALDASGHLYVAGSIDDTANAGAAGWTVIKYAPNGTPLWRRTDVRSDGVRDGMSRLFVDAAGNLLGAGPCTTVQHGQPSDLVATKLDANGNKLWRRTFSETSISDEAFADAALDRVGNLYVTGETVPSTNPELVHTPILLKYSPDGAQQFVVRGGGAGGSSVAVDPFGDIVASGMSQLEGGNVDVIATAKYDASGNRKWLTPNLMGDVSIDSVGNIYLFSELRLFTANQSDLQTTKLSSAGTIVWQHRYDGRLTSTNASADRPVAATVDTFDNLFEVANAQDGTLDDIVTLRYAANESPQAPPTTLEAPSSLSASANSGRVTLTWTDRSSQESAFSIERCVGNSCTSFAPYAQVGANVTTYTDTAVARRTTYRYRVRATNGAVVSPFSNVASVTTPRR